MVLSPSKAVISYNYVALSETRTFSHETYTSQHRTNSALNVPETNTERWGRGDEAEERHTQVAGASGQREQKRTLTRNSP